MVTQRERKAGKRKEISKHKGRVGGISFPSCPFDVILSLHSASKVVSLE
jgi:hypothetical protein